MDDVTSKLTTEQQALKIVARLKGGKLRKSVVAEATNILTVIGLDDTAEDVFIVLDSIDVQDCWDRSGSSRHGYTSPDEAATEIIGEELQPFFDQVDDTINRVCQSKKRSITCRYDERESTSEFREWSVDVPAECAGFLLDKWRERNREKVSINSTHEFVRKRCPEWAKWLKDK